MTAVAANFWPSMMHHYGAGGGAGSPQQFCLRWNNYQSNLTNVFDQLLQSESFVDVTLACDGHSVKAHKMVLSACSPYFQALFFDNPCQHPIVILKDIKWPELKAVVEFMYKGEINVSQEQIGPLLKVAESLKIRGLADVNSEHDLEAKPGEEGVSMSPQRPMKKRRRTSIEPSSPSEEVPEALELVTTSPPSSLPPPVVPTPMSSSNSMLPLPLPPPPPPPPPPTSADDMEIKPGIAEMIREEERAKMLESSHAWLGASTSSLADSSPTLLKMKVPTWTPALLKEAIQAVVTQKMRFTQASAQYGIPKGTLYDNILGKSNRMMVLEEAGLTTEEELAVLEFCCDVSVSPYNRRTKKSLISILGFVENLRKGRDPDFAFTGLAGFRWWWAFCKKYSIVYLNYDKLTNCNNNNTNSPPPARCTDQIHFGDIKCQDQVQFPDKQINSVI
uniref:BTB domain-containing protein n=2 Tax=Clastoptera arizonana TaxID=38151 RepID=A0A1B6DU19_9HEMI